MQKTARVLFFALILIIAPIMKKSLLFALLVMPFFAVAQTEQADPCQSLLKIYEDDIRGTKYMRFKKSIWPSNEGFGNFSVDFLHIFGSPYPDGLIVNYKDGCAEEKTGFTFLFSDSTRVKAASFGKFSCSGSLHISIGNSISDNRDLKEKLLNFELIGIAFSTVSHAYSRKLTTEESVLLKKSFGCFWQKAEADRAKK